MMELALLGYFPMIVAFHPYQPSIVAEATKVVSSGLLKMLGYLLHVPKQV